MKLTEIPLVKRAARGINNYINPVDNLISDQYELLRNASAPIFEEILKDSKLKNLPPIHAAKDALLNGMRNIKTAKDNLRNNIKEVRKEANVKPTTSVPGTSYLILKPFYKYERIDQFFNKESYFSRSVTKQVEALMRNGYELQCDDPDVVRNLKVELNSMKMRGNVRINGKISKMALELFKNGICIIEKERDASGDIENFRIIPPQNIAFYIHKETYEILGAEDPISADRKRRKNIPTYGKNFQPGILPKDLIVMTIYDAGELIFPEPPCFQMLDDILSLRSLEETVEMLAFQFGSPLLHIKVGEKDEPATENDVLRVHNNVVAMAPNGMITTDHKTTIDAVNLLSGTIDLMPSIEHFKNRVLVGSGSSAVLVGEGDTSNRNTAATIDDSQADHCMHIGNIIAETFTYDIIPDIMGYKNESEIFDKEGEPIIKMEFNEVKLEKKIAKDNHTTMLYQSNVITSKEARKRMKAKPFSEEDEKDTHVQKVQMPLKRTAPPKEGTGSSSSGTSGSVKQKTMPANQHGTKSGPGSTKN